MDNYNKTINTLGLFSFCTICMLMTTMGYTQKSNYHTFRTTKLSDSIRQSFTTVQSAHHTIPIEIEMLTKSNPLFGPRDTLYAQYMSIRNREDQSELSYAIVDIAEALLDAGQLELSLKYYRIALDQYPKNHYALQMIHEISQTIKSRKKTTQEKRQFNSFRNTYRTKL